MRRLLSFMHLPMQSKVQTYGEVTRSILRSSPWTLHLTHQVASGSTTRARVRAIGTKVNSLLFELDMNMNETWMLPHNGTLYVIGTRKTPTKGLGSLTKSKETSEKNAEEEAQQQEEGHAPRQPRVSCPPANFLDTPCARASVVADVHPMRTFWTPRAHGPLL